VSRALGRAVSLLALAALALAIGALWGRPSGLAAGAGATALAFLIWVYLPRAAHRAFRRGLLSRASRLYRLQRALRLDRRARAQLDVSLAACAVARSEFEVALARLDLARPDDLGDAGRAAWLNNRAYARARRSFELDTALVDIDAALSLRPDVAGFRHTRGVVLLGLGRLEEAIRELDAAWRQRAEGDDAPAEEAERCYDLGVAWASKGERDYAADYFARARLAAPESTWARRAAACLAEREPAALAAR
jgi:tetratricopeptide (TPR) repeat protein